MAKTARRWSSLDKAAVRILAKIKEEDRRDLSYRQMAKMTGMTPSRLSGLFLETMGPPTLDEFCTLCELFEKSAPQTLQSAITESQNMALANTHKGCANAAVDDANAALADADNGIDIYDMAERIKAEDAVNDE
ncbi:hypothetical protein [Bifidobacterium criceti]|uniref:HTH cro/C1-type domain-containing protein n=1 Tax=Bifidobacterium criceti TaxID=1960969 RepID=A0A2A2EE63_9BIFI|nr:hypothetical protein [Bifidobacterium criceti]PAU67188.1 hypothetical protein B1526_1272 [Bifidobacterium criceti]